jgi:hypothetical protein
VVVLRDLVSFVFGVAVFGGRLTGNSCFWECGGCYGFWCCSFCAVSGMDGCESREDERRC